MLPGSDFGLNYKQLLSRIAFVDFDGKEALNLFFKNKNTDLKKICPKIIKGINKLKDWVIKN